jgi:hypothetical protein
MKTAAVLLVLWGMLQDGPPLRKAGPKVGDAAPDFELKLLESRETFKLSGNFGKRPTVLIFHSFT